jgi:hypothetical protein
MSSENVALQTAVRDLATRVHGDNGAHRDWRRIIYTVVEMENTY